MKRYSASLITKLVQIKTISMMKSEKKRKTTENTKSIIVTQIHVWWKHDLLYPFEKLALSVIAKHNCTQIIHHLHS